MAKHTSPNNLQTALEKRCERVFMQKSAVLFRRGEKEFGLFLILSGKVSLDFGADTPYTRCHGPGALMGLPGDPDEARLLHDGYSYGKRRTRLLIP